MILLCKSISKEINNIINFIGDNLVKATCYLCVVSGLTWKRSTCLVQGGFNEGIKGHEGRCIPVIRTNLLRIG